MYAGAKCKHKQQFEVVAVLEFEFVDKSVVIFLLGHHIFNMFRSETINGDCGVLPR